MENIKEWLKVDSRSGYGYGSGSGYGDGSGSGYGSGSGSGSGSWSGSGSGYGYGYGSGSGYGDGSGYGSGSGSGSGDGCCLAKFNGKEVHLIDNVPTIIISIHLSLAKGFIIDSDLSLAPCYVVKGNGMFAHGDTPEKAQEALRKKIFENMDPDEAIEKFMEKFKPGEKYTGHDFFEWHHYLTGSCEAGRKAFVRNHDIDLDKLYTVEEFIELTENDFEGEVIRKLKKRWEENWPSGGRRKGMEHILSLSYGKDSLACLGAIEALGWPLDRIVHAEVWATNTIPADLPPMVEFKAKADRIIKERWGIEVEHMSSRWTYERQFYETFGKGVRAGEIYGFAMTITPWCNSRLKAGVLDSIDSDDCVKYLGIAADEPNRFHNLTETKRSPLVEAGWTEAMCRTWCEENDLLSPIYTTATRGGCWFCHNQGVDQLRLLRRDYPEYWALLMKWDLDSPVTFKPDGHTVHDFEERFKLEDQ